VNTGSLTGRLTEWAQEVAAWFGIELRETDDAESAVARAKEVEFTHCLVALAAKLIAADGSPGAAKYAAFRSVFPFASVEEAKLRSLFVRAMNDRVPLMQVVRHIRRLYPDMPLLYRELLQRMLVVAQADGPLGETGRELLQAAALAFDVPAEEWRAMLLGQHSTRGDPYALLGVNPRTSDAELRKRYMAQVRLLHPDRYHSEGASAEQIGLLSDKLAAINAAYETITQTRAAKKGN
jgi:DnaJ like chaperone protein